MCRLHRPSQARRHRRQSRRRLHLGRRARRLGLKLARSRATRSPPVACGPLRVKMKLCQGPCLPPILRLRTPGQHLPPLILVFRFRPIQRQRLAVPIQVRSKGRGYRRHRKAQDATFLILSGHGMEPLCRRRSRCPARRPCPVRCRSRHQASGPISRRLLFLDRRTSVPVRLSHEPEHRKHDRNAAAANATASPRRPTPENRPRRFRA